MSHLLHGPGPGHTETYLDIERLNDVMPDQLEVWMAEPVLHIGPARTPGTLPLKQAADPCECLAGPHCILAACKIVVDHRDLVALLHQLIDQVRANEPRAPSHQNALPVFKVQRCRWREHLLDPLLACFHLLQADPQAVRQLLGERFMQLRINKN